MKYIYLLSFIIVSHILIGQNNPRADFENELQGISDDLYSETKAHFTQGPIFIFDEPYLAVFIKGTDYSVGVPPNSTKITFAEGDKVLVLGAAPVGKVLQFRAQDSDDIFSTKAFGHPGFDVENSVEFTAQLQKIKGSDWQQAERLASMLSCGSLESVGQPNFEKHHLNIGDTPVFFQIRLEADKLLLYFNLRTYGGIDFKDMGVAQADKSELSLVFGDESTATIKCESDDDRFAIFDVTSLRSQFLLGIGKITFVLSEKEVTKELKAADKFAIGLKMECIKQD